MKIIKQLKKATMSNNNKIKKKLAKKIDKKILKALEERYHKAKKQKEEAKTAFKMAKAFFEKNQAEKTSKKKDNVDQTKSPTKTKAAKQPKTKKTVAKKSTSKKPASNAKVTTLSQLEPTKKNIKRLPKSLRVKKSKTTPKAKSTSKKGKTALPKKVAVKKTVLKVVESTPTKPEPTAKPITKKVTTPPKPAAKPVTKKAPTKKNVANPKSETKPVAEKTAPKKAVAPRKSVAKPATKKVSAKPTITKTQMENLKIVEGIGPAIERILKSKDIKTLADLSKAKIGVLRTIMAEAGSRFKIHKPDTWARQARLAAAGKFDELKEWQKELNGGKR